MDYRSHVCNEKFGMEINNKQGYISFMEYLYKSRYEHVTVPILEPISDKHPVTSK